MLPQLRELLLDPDWLRRKLAAAGTTAVVADFRRRATRGARPAHRAAAPRGAKPPQLPLWALVGSARYAHPACNVCMSSCNPCIDLCISGPPLVVPQPSCHALPAVTCPACCRYLLLDNCPDMKLVLEAFQLSAAQAVAYPRAPGLLRCLMAGRLVTAPLSPALQVRRSLALLHAF